MNKVQCPKCGVAIRVADNKIYKEGKKFMTECCWCSEKIDIGSQLKPQFELNENNKPDEFWNKLH